MIMTGEKLLEIQEAFGPETAFGKMCLENLQETWQAAAYADVRSGDPDGDQTDEVVNTFLAVELGQESLHHPLGSEVLDGVRSRLGALGFSPSFG